MSDPSLFDEMKESSTQTPPAAQETDVSAQAAASEQPTDTPPSTPNDTLDTMLASIRAEDGRPKYKDLPTALEALKHSQEYIPGLKEQLSQKDQELETLRKQLEERESVDDIVSRLASKGETPQPADQPATQGFSQEDIEGLLEQRLAQREQAQLSQANQLQVSEALRSQYGEKASEVLKSKANELGLSADQIGDWASKSPKAVLALFGASAPAASAPNRSSVNIPPSSPNQEIEVQPVKRFASAKEMEESMRQHRASVYQKLGIKE